jgi:hypothetical protein
MVLSMVLRERVDFCSPEAVLGDIPPTVAGALLAAPRDPSPDIISRAELAIVLHAGGPDTRSADAAVL